MTKDTTPTPTLEILLRHFYNDAAHIPLYGVDKALYDKTIAAIATQLAACVPEKYEEDEFGPSPREAAFNEAIEIMQTNLNAFLKRPPEGEVK